MEDSPLSVIANIAGILTFAVAILASIYVRFVSLRNGRIEMETIRKSVDDVVNDLDMMKSPSSGVLQGHAHFIVNEGDKQDAVWLKKLGTSLLATEMFIFAYCARATNGRSGTADFALSSAQKLQDGVITLTTFEEADQEAKEASDRDVFTYRLSEFLARQFPMTWVLYVLTAGSTPTLVRWYRVRERVLEKVRQREILRSRILSHQVTMANS